MLLQRLVTDDKIGFNYDYMGSAEYENGATKKGRTAIAQAFLDGKIKAKATNFVEMIGPNHDTGIPVVVMGLAETIDSIGDELEIRVFKETFRTRDKNMVGWMNVAWHGHELNPLLIVRADLSDAQERINKFFGPVIGELKAAAQ